MSMETRMLLPQAPDVAVGAKRPPPASANQAQPDVGPPPARTDQLEAVSNDLAKLAPAHAEQIHIKVVTPGGRAVYFKCEQTTPLQNVLHAFCHRQCVPTNSVRFLFNGNKINDWQTPQQLDMAQQLDMEECAVIDVAVEQQAVCIANPVLRPDTQAQAVGRLLEAQQFQFLQVTRPLHGDTVLPGQRIYVADPQGNRFSKTVPANVAPGATFHIRVPMTTAPPLPGIMASGSLSTRFAVDTLKQFAASRTHAALEFVYESYAAQKLSGAQTKQVGAPTPPMLLHPNSAPHQRPPALRCTLNTNARLRPHAAQMMYELHRVAGKKASRRAMRALKPQLRLLCLVIGPGALIADVEAEVKFDDSSYD